MHGERGGACGQFKWIELKLKWRRVRDLVLASSRDPAFGSVMGV
jgi:hypothetical protein